MKKFSYICSQDKTNSMPCYKDITRIFVQNKIIFSHLLSLHHKHVPFEFCFCLNFVFILLLCLFWYIIFYHIGIRTRNRVFFAKTRKKKFFISKNKVIQFIHSFIHPIRHSSSSIKTYKYIQIELKI